MDKYIKFQHMDKYVKFADSLSVAVGKAFSWCIVILCLGTCYEVIMAYAFNKPTLWNFDFSLQMYGAIFMMAGAYTLSTCLLYTSPSPRDVEESRMPSSA